MVGGECLIWCGAVVDTWFLVKDIVGKKNCSHKKKKKIVVKIKTEFFFWSEKKTDLIIHSKYNFEIIISRK